HWGLCVGLRHPCGVDAGDGFYAAADGRCAPAFGCPVSFFMSAPQNCSAPASCPSGLSPDVAGVCVVPPRATPDFDPEWLSMHPGAVVLGPGDPAVNVYDGLFTTRGFYTGYF